MSDNPCKLFAGAKDKHGYGRKRFEGQNRLAHRVAYCEHHGLKWADITGKVIRHTCDNPPCVEPSHLIEGTQADNMADVAARERSGQIILPSETVLYIREHYVKGHREFGQRALARRFNVSQHAVYQIVHNNTRTAWQTH